MICKTGVKLNLGLRVVSRRPDGYHNLETLFVPYYGFGDVLEIVRSDEWSETSSYLQERYSGDNFAQAITPDGKLMISIFRDGGVAWDPLKDLTAKAYGLLNEEFGLPSMKIYLEKKAPVGAGLGGGSADAAAALRMISEIAGLGLDPEALAARAVRLGSDCAFFIYDEPMIGTGRGEILTPFEIDLSRFKVEVTVPEGISVSTADAYRGIVPSVPEKPLREVLRQHPSTWKKDLVNDFEATVFASYPALARVKADFYDRGAVYAAMSGSGSAIFGLFPE